MYDVYELDVVSQKRNERSLRHMLVALSGLACVLMFASFQEGAFEATRGENTTAVLVSPRAPRHRGHSS